MNEDMAPSGENFAATPVDAVAQTHASRKELAGVGRLADVIGVEEARDWFDARDARIVAVAALAHRHRQRQQAQRTPSWMIRRAQNTSSPRPLR